MGLTRRGFLGRSALAAAAPWWLPDYLLQSVGLRKCVSMGSINHGGDLQDLSFHGNLERVLATGAGWVRIWIRWDKAQPLPPEQLPLSELGSEANDLPGCGAGCGFRYMRAIDRQVADARAAGLGVVLVTWHFPRWANGTAGRPPDWGREDRGGREAPVERLKPFEWRFPVGQLGEDGYYGRWLAWLMDRYAAHGRSLVLEVMNEPNLQLWPQQGPPPGGGDPFAPGPPVMPSYTGEMMATAAALSAARGRPIGIGGPALSDRMGADGRLMTSFETAVLAILEAMASVGGAPELVWTHHNYGDVEGDLASPTRAERVRELLRGRWRGRGGPADPRVWLTEGGARLGSGEATGLAEQAELVRRNWARMTRAPGIEMSTNYLLYADPVANSGLYAPGGGRRPVWEAFRTAPVYR